MHVFNKNYQEEKILILKVLKRKLNTIKLPVACNIKLRTFTQPYINIMPINQKYKLRSNSITIEDMYFDVCSYFKFHIAHPNSINNTIDAIKLCMSVDDCRNCKKKL